MDSRRDRQPADSSHDLSSDVRRHKVEVLGEHSTAEREADRESRVLLSTSRARLRGSFSMAFEDLRTAAQQRYGSELRDISISDNPQSAALAEGLSARGLTYGSQIHISPAMHAHRQDMLTTAAHEMVHAVQQSGGAENDAAVTSSTPAVAMRRSQAMGEQWFTVKLNRINYLLSYRFFDWAITDAEASEAFHLLKSMGSVERATALSAIRVDRLRDNLPSKSQVDALDVMLKQTESMRTNTQDLNRLLDTHLFDWAVTDKEATTVLKRLQALPVPDRYFAIMGISRRVLMGNLGPIQQAEFDMMWAEAQEWWNRQRQQRDPLGPGDEIRIRVYNAVAGDFEDSYFPPDLTYVISQSESVTLPMIGRVDVSGQRPDDIAARVADLLHNEYLHRAAVSVEVVKRGSEIFTPRDFTFAEKQPATPLEPGDTFTLMVVDSQTLTEETDFNIGYHIDPGGTVELPHIGRITAAGKTREELTAAIHEHLSGWYRKTPIVWVSIRAHNDTVYKPAPGKPHVAARHSTTEWLATREPLNLPTRRPVDIYLEFYRKKSAELQAEDLSDRERRIGQEALFRFMDWLSQNSGDTDLLTAKNPYAVYGDIYMPLMLANIERSSREVVMKERRKKQAAREDALVERKLDEYYQWATARWRESSVKFRSAGPAHLITEHPYRKIGLDKLTEAVLTWAHAHTDHPDFESMTPNEVAVMLMREDKKLAAIVEIGRQAKPRLEYFPELDRTRRTMGDTALEVFIGILPILGEAQDFSDLTTGVSITGEKLGTTDRVLAGFALIIPFVPGSALRSGDELVDVVTDLSKATGRSAAEIDDLFRVAGNLNQSDARHIERIMEKVGDGKKLSDADLDILDDIALKLKGPLEELGKARKAGGELPVKPLRVDPVSASRLVPGTPEHMSQRWIEYQVRHGSRYSRLTNKIEPKWQRLYETIIANKKAGGQFETDVLGWLDTKHLPGVKKNNQMMISDVEDAKGFIPDGVKGNPSELIWGQPYHLVEVKGWKAMSKTGNLKAMIEYVDEFGGHIEVVFRSSKHPDGLTELSGPLEDVLNRLASEGKATIRRYPD